LPVSWIPVPFNFRRVLLPVPAPTSIPLAPLIPPAAVDVAYMFKEVVAKITVPGPFIWSFRIPELEPGIPPELKVTVFEAAA